MTRNLELIEVKVPFGLQSVGYYRRHYPQMVEQIENSYLVGSCDLDDVEEAFKTENKYAKAVAPDFLRSRVCEIIGLVKQDLVDSLESYKDLENEWQQEDYAQRFKDFN